MKQPLKICKVVVNYDWDEKDGAFRKSRMIGMTTIPFRINNGSLSKGDSWDLVEELFLIEFDKTQTKSVADTYKFLEGLKYGEFTVTVCTPLPHWIMGSSLQWAQSVKDFQINEFDQQNFDPQSPITNYASLLIVIPLGEKDSL